ncbi:hypothetical protein C8J57DRAFT_1219999 [Mycena rebaudengoi]|nr:hypothetical protein C8J57DRAFT_1219999 [Mycena rebaudengoi]
MAVHARAWYYVTAPNISARTNDKFNSSPTGSFPQIYSSSGVILHVNTSLIYPSQCLVNSVKTSKPLAKLCQPGVDHQVTPDIPGFGDVQRLCTQCQALPFWNCIYNVDFHTPVVYRSDCTALTNDEESVFYTTLFGKAAGPVRSLDGHRTFRMEWGNEGGDALAKLFYARFSPFGAVVLDDNNNDEIVGTLQNIAVTMCADINRATGTGGSYLELHVSHVGTTRCSVHTGPTPTKVCIPTLLEDHPVRAGDWVVAIASLHKRCTEIHQDRMLTPRQDYEFLIKEMRTLTLSAAAASGEAESPVGGHNNEVFTEATATDADADMSDTATLNSNEERPEDTAAPSSFTRRDASYYTCQRCWICHHKKPTTDECGTQRKAADSASLGKKHYTAGFAQEQKGADQAPWITGRKCVTIQFTAMNLGGCNLRNGVGWLLMILWGYLARQITVGVVCAQMFLKRRPDIYALFNGAFNLPHLWVTAGPEWRTMGVLGGACGNTTVGETRDAVNC